MEQLESFTQTVFQAPWRKQTQIIGLISLIVVVVALIAGLYLSVSAQITKTGRQIQALQGQIETLNLEVEDLQSKLAFMLSAEEMEKRALELGFELIQVEKIIYLSIPGYIERQPPVLASNTDQAVIRAQVIPPEYTKTLIEWMIRQLGSSNE